MQNVMQELKKMCQDYLTRDQQGSNHEYQLGLLIEEPLPLVPKQLTTESLLEWVNQMGMVILSAKSSKRSGDDLDTAVDSYLENV
jgi:hypothetical protein